jgi:hypothetical protein
MVEAQGRRQGVAPHMSQQSNDTRADDHLLRSDCRLLLQQSGKGRQIERAASVAPGLECREQGLRIHEVLVADVDLQTGRSMRDGQNARKMGQGDQQAN